VRRRGRLHHGDDSSPASPEFLGAGWFDPIEAAVRDRVRGFIEELVDAELDAALVSRAITAWCRQKRRANPRYVRMTKQVEAAIAGAYLSGTNTRRVRRALGALFKGAVGKDVVAEPGRRCRRTGRRGAGARWLKRMLPGWSWMARYGSTARRHRSRCWLCWVFAAMGRRCSCGAQHGRRERGGLGRSAG
jgi:hypothetical protein